MSFWDWVKLWAMYALSWLPVSRCNGECNQGRNCDCCESGLTDDDLDRRK